MQDFRFPQGLQIHQQRSPSHSQKYKTNDLMLNLTPENMTGFRDRVTTIHKGSSTPTKMSKINGRQIQ